MPWTDDDFDALCRYAVTLERAISIVAAALRENDHDYALGVLEMIEGRIREGSAAEARLAEIEAEHATRH